MPSLPNDEVHIRLLRLPEQPDAGFERACLELLCSSERDKLARFLTPQAAREYVLTRAFVRTTLSRYADVSPSAWRFAVSPHGKPEIALPLDDGYRGLRFNLSHTKGLLACAITVDHEVGVDVECLSRELSFLEIAEHHFAETEIQAINALPPSARAERFFAYWTLKEAYGKARGVGLSLPLSSCTFAVDARPITLQSRMPDLAAVNWQFGLERVEPVHMLAYAVRNAEGPRLRVGLHDDTTSDGPGRSGRSASLGCPEPSG